MAEAADAVAKRLDLIANIIRCAGKAGPAFDQLLDRRCGLFDRIAVSVPDEAAALAARFEHCDVGGKRVVAGRVSEWLRHDHRGADIVSGEIGAAQPLLARRPDSDDRSVSKTVGARRPAELLRAFAVGVEHWPRGR